MHDSCARYTPTAEVFRHGLHDLTDAENNKWRAAGRNKMPGEVGPIRPGPPQIPQALAEIQWRCLCRPSVIICAESTEHRRY